MKDLENPMEEVQRQIQKFFIQKEREWEFKLNEMKQTENEELALCKIKLKSAETLLSRMDEFTKLLQAKGITTLIQHYLYSIKIFTAQSLTRQNSSNGFLGQQADGYNGNGLNTPQQSARTFSPDLLADITRERDVLREEFGQLENRQILYKYQKPKKC
jgi:hypothetical protein